MILHIKKSFLIVILHTGELVSEIYVVPYIHKVAEKSKIILTSLTAVDYQRTLLRNLFPKCRTPVRRAQFYVLLKDNAGNNLYMRTKAGMAAHTIEEFISKLVAFPCVEHSFVPHYCKIHSADCAARSPLPPNMR